MLITVKEAAELMFVDDKTVHSWIAYLKRHPKHEPRIISSGEYKIYIDRDSLIQALAKPEGYEDAKTLCKALSITTRTLYPAARKGIVRRLKRLEPGYWYHVKDATRLAKGEFDARKRESVKLNRVKAWIKEHVSEEQIKMGKVPREIRRQCCAELDVKPDAWKTAMLRLGRPSRDERRDIIKKWILEHTRIWSPPAQIHREFNQKSGMTADRTTIRTYVHQLRDEANQDDSHLTQSRHSNRLQPVDSRTTPAG